MTLKTKWQVRLKRELHYRAEFSHLTREEWGKLIAKRTILSRNHDTVLSIDWPHYCRGASQGCGGPNGWCYTMSGHLAGATHDRKVAMIDQAARNEPGLLAEKTAEEIRCAVNSGLLPYPNLRYSGSGELSEHHIPFLELVSAAGVRLWGFTRLPRIGLLLREIGATVIISCDYTTPHAVIDEARYCNFPLAYTSLNCGDSPPDGTIVTFPVHRGGSVREAVNHASLCPKVIDEFFHGDRLPGWCQERCKRCHEF